MSSVAMEEYEVMKEAKYRLYVSAVDKALKAFESTNEWPDLISALGKLNKVLKENQRYPVIPRKIKISKRLAQCTHFALPAGVHLKALQTYDTIFKCMGTNRLSHELFIYSAGLFPLFGHSAMNVKPLLLTIYETHFVPLGPRLRPGLSGFLSGVLPGLEEGSDHFDRTNSLLEKVCDGVGSEYFYTCIWECVCNYSAIRLPAVSFALAHFNKKLTMEEQKFIMGNDINIMVNALCAGVQDSNVLVQRSSLDLLLVGFPMHSSLLGNSSLVDLVTSAIATVLRRDMSLNRRLYAWLLGSDLNVSQLSLDHPFLKKLETLGDASQSSLYFETYSKENLIQGFKSALKQQNMQSPDIRPYRLLMSLLDKQDVGPVILDEILYEVFRTLYLSCRESKFDGTKSKQEILKSANLLFGSLEPWYVWLYMGSLFDQACKVNIEELTTILEIQSSMTVKEVGSGFPNIWEVCELCEFLLGVIPLEASGENSNEFLLNLILHVVSQLTMHIKTLSPQQIARCLKLCTSILGKIQPFGCHGKTRVKSEEKIPDSEQINAGLIRSRVGNEKPEMEIKTKVGDDSEGGFTSGDSSRFSAIFKNFLKQYEIFYVTLVGGGRIIHGQMVLEAFESMKKNPEGGRNENDYAKELRRILTAVMNDDDTSEVFAAKKEELTRESERFGSEVAVEDNEKWEEAFAVASEILVKLSSFPVVRVDLDASENTAFLPWMKFLVVCACRLEKSPSLHLVAIKTLLDLLSLSKLSSSSSGEGVIALLNYSQAEFLEHHTNVLEILSRILWKHLGELSYDFQVRCIELLYQLHALFLSDDSLERVLGEALLRGTENGRVESLRRFSKIWHIGREIQMKKIQQRKLFHKCLLKVLDNLLLPDNLPLKIETQTCLVQSLIKGDLPRLLDPVLLMLLDPATARMSILHVSIQHSNVGSENQEQHNCQTDENSNKIYAISSVDGNVIYHVSNALTEKGMLSKKLKWRWKKNSKVLSNSHQRIFAVTSLNDRGDNRSTYVTQKNHQREIELPPTFEGSISVLVNPFFRGYSDYDFSGGDYSTQSSDHQSDSLKSLNWDPEKNKRDDPEMVLRQPRVTLEVTTTESPPGELRFFGQLKNKLMDLAHGGECEDSHSADEYFSRNEKEEDSTSETSLEVVNRVLNSLVDSVVKNCRETESAEKDSKSGIAVHPYHSHFLLYCGVYDSCRTLYAFNTLKNIILTNSRLFLCCAATSGIASAPFSSDLITLLARHKKSVFGRNFHGGTKSLNEYMAIYVSNMYLEVLVSICLHFARSYYPNLGVLKLTSDEIAGNRQVQLASVETLMHICNELIPIVRDSGKGFANYIADLLNRCKVQKTILYCIMTSLLSIHRQQNYSSEPKSFTEEILDFNDPDVEGGSNQTAMTEHSSAFQIQLLKVLQSLIMLEQQIESQKADGGDGGQLKGTSVESAELESKYTPDSSIPNQPMFMKGIVTALSLKGTMRFLHYNWTELITSSLPYLGTAMPQVVMVAINQICATIEELAIVYSNRKSEKDEYFPPGYAVTQLEALTVLCHFCILDSNQQISPQPFVPPIGSNSSGTPVSNPAQILSNLVHVFTSTSLTQDAGKSKNQHQTEILSTVRKNLLANMPRIISSVVTLWQAVTEALEQDTDLCIWGNPKVVKNQILELLSPISLHHGPTFLAAVAVAWEERKGSDDTRKVLPIASPGQQVLVNLVGAIKVMPIDTLVQTVHAVVKQPPAIQGASPNVSLDVSVLELFYKYMQSSTSSQLAECWTSLLGLLRDGLSVPPPALFLVLAILNEFVQKCSSFQDKKNQKDLQDITTKLVEACGNVAGACLENKTWLGRNLSVKEAFDSPEEDTEGLLSTVQQHSVQAQLVLAQILAPLLDVSHGSQEKDKVATLLTNLMYNITPYLKSHLPKNAPSFAACSQLLANLSGFQYTRKAWKREVFELLLESSLFQMDIGCLSYWTTIIDNLMTHDITSFRDLMSKISMSQGGSYTLFSSREQEHEQRSQLLKRLAFVIFCSEADQYHKFMPTIQERLSEILRLPQVVPSVQAQVFLCFRILLLRMSPHHVISLWPIVISEMVQVFTLVEQELCTDSEEFRASSHIKLMSALDSSWVSNSSNGLHAHGHPHWLHLIFAAAKLLDLAVLLPTQHLPQFQMYRWAFVSDPSSKCSQSGEKDGQNGHDFVPHVVRICRLMDAKYGPARPVFEGKEGRLLLEGSQIDSLQELHSFFASIGSREQSTAVDMESVEKIILQDFLEKFPTKGNH